MTPKEFVVEPTEPAKGEGVKVKVLRVCVNPRLVLCGYQDGGLERRVFVKVGKNANFTRGMTLEAIRPERETEPWGYIGRLPRFKGHW